MGSTATLFRHSSDGRGTSRTTVNLGTLFTAFLPVEIDADDLADLNKTALTVVSSFKRRPCTPAEDGAPGDGSGGTTPQPGGGVDAPGGTPVADLEAGGTDPVLLARLEALERAAAEAREAMLSALPAGRRRVRAAAAIGPAAPLVERGATSARFDPVNLAAAALLDGPAAAVSLGFGRIGRDIAAALDQPTCWRSDKTIHAAEGTVAGLEIVKVRLKAEYADLLREFNAGGGVTMVARYQVRTVALPGSPSQSPYYDLKNDDWILPDGPVSFTVSQGCRGNDPGPDGLPSCGSDEVGGTIAALVVFDRLFVLTVDAKAKDKIVAAGLDFLFSRFEKTAHVALVQFKHTATESIGLREMTQPGGGSNP